MVVTGYDDRHGCGYVLRTGPDTAAGLPGGQTVTHQGIAVLATPELAASLRDALTQQTTVRTDRTGAAVPMTLDDPTVLAWLTAVVGGVLTVRRPTAPPRR